MIRFRYQIKTIIFALTGQDLDIDPDLERKHMIDLEVIKGIGIGIHQRIEILEIEIVTGIVVEIEITIGNVKEGMKDIEVGLKGEEGRKKEETEAVLEVEQEEVEIGVSRRRSLIGVALSLMMILCQEKYVFFSLS